MGTDKLLFRNDVPMADRGADGWIQTHRGKFFYYLEENPENVDIEDIAHALSNICRYAGQTKVFYSVAQHCCIVSDLAADGDKLDALMHDAAEAYMGDIPRPVKLIVPELKILEKKIYRQIATQFNLSWPIPSMIELLDTQVMITEAKQVMEKDIVWEIKDLIPAIFEIKEFWTPERAETEFLKRFMELNGRDNVHLKYGVSL